MQLNNGRKKGEIIIAGNKVLRHEVESYLDCGTILIMNQSTSNVVDYS